MNTTKPTFTDEERNRLHSVNNSFEEIKHRKKVFIQTIFSESDRRTVDHHPGATLKLDEDGNSIFFDGYGYTLQAQPEYLLHKNEWRVKYLFHVRHTALDGKKHFTPLYQIEICGSGLVYMGGEDPAPIDAGWKHEDFVYNRLKANLLCALVKNLGSTEG